MKPSCETCRFVRNLVPQMLYTCHRYPLLNKHWGWPEVNADDLCGEWRRAAGHAKGKGRGK